MENLLGTCLAIGILVGGFAVTGDLGRLAARGMRVIQATDVPLGAGQAAVPVPAAAPVSASAATAVTTAAGVVPRPAVVAGPPRRGTGPERVDLAAARPGQRILVWLDTNAEPLPIDVVDPATAAVILHGGPPRRATIAGGAVVRGESLHVISLGLAHEGSRVDESLGTVTGIGGSR